MTHMVKSEKRSIAIIGAGNMACVYANKAREKGIYTHCFAWANNASAKDVVDVFHDISIFEKATILQICKAANICAVIPTTELTIPIAAYIADNMGLPSMGYNLSCVITDKYWVREKTKICTQIRNPKICKVTSNDFCPTWDAFPAIVKPIAEGGKRGVVVVHRKDSLKEAIDFAMQYDKKKMGVLIEEYIGGNNEYSVESLSFQGKHQIIQITEKISSGPPHCVELGHHQPAMLSKELREKVVAATKELLDAVAFLNGPTHTEIKIYDGEIWLIELNARPGGDHIASTLTHLSTGYDYIGEAIESYMGREPQKQQDTDGLYSGVFFVTKQTRYLKKTFDSCDCEPWLYEKHVESNVLTELLRNDCMHTNYMIYSSNHRINLEYSEVQTYGKY